MPQSNSSTAYVAYPPGINSDARTARPITSTLQPAQLLHNEVGLVLKNIFYLFFILAGPLDFGPFMTSRYNELSLWDPSTYGTVASQVLLSLFTLFVLVSPFLTFLFPAWFFFTIHAGAAGVAWFVLWVQGEVVIDPSPAVRAQVSVQPGERWFFVNGIATDKTLLRKNIDNLSLLVGRPIRGVHNKTLGVVGDLLECLIQRDLSYFTEDARALYEEVVRALDEGANRVVLLAHSQGGIIVSNVVDRLLVDLSAPMLRRLEIYTFASAANHFSSGLIRRWDANIQDYVVEPNIYHVEHFVQGCDFVSRIGVLEFGVRRSKSPGCLFYGRIFSRPNGWSHLLNANYIDAGFFSGPGAANFFASNGCRFIQYFKGGVPPVAPPLVGPQLSPRPLV